MKLPTQLLTYIAALPLLICAAPLQAQITATVTTLHSFDNDGPDGSLPQGSLVQGTDGDFYGTTNFGNNVNFSTIYKITPAGEFSSLHAFNSTDGSDPHANLIQNSDGNFYGTTYGGGAAGNYGTVFRISPSGVTLTLYSFTGGGDGSNPICGLTKGSDGNFYGTTSTGGAGFGTIFRLTPSGSLTTLHTFTNSSTDGNGPNAGLLKGSDGNFYGTTRYGGSNGDGMVFKITPAGVFTILHTFTDNGDDGSHPIYNPPILGSDGNFYGTANEGGNNGYGVVYKLTPAGVYSTLHNFTSNGAEGAYPNGGLVRGSDGNFYGTTYRGGSQDNGVVYQLTPAGGYTTLHSFTGQNSDGAHGVSALIQAKDGNFYGTTYNGGSSGVGTIFRLNVIPAITSAATATATVNQAFLYQITALNSPTTFSATGVPSGLTVSTSKGTISGRPTISGVFNVTVKATNVFGTGTAKLTLTVKGPPVITSAKSAAGTLGKAFSFQITATGSPTKYGESGHLATGLKFNTTTGKISGRPTKAGAYSVAISASNSYGAGTATLTITVKAAPPAITSATTATARVGVAFLYTTVATNDPTKYGESGHLPDGLTMSASTGKISGRPTKAGTFTVTLAAFNSAGSGTAKLTITVQAATPPLGTGSLDAPVR